MAKKKQESKEKPKRPQTSQDLIKKLGAGAFITGAQLEDAQHDLVHVSPKLDLVLGGGIPGGSVVTIAGDPKCGKCQDIDSIIHTPNGPKRIGDIKAGDVVCTPDSSSAQVTRIFPQGVKPIYEIEFDNGDVVRSCNEHLWKVKAQQRHEYEVLQLSDFMDDLFYSDRPKWQVPLPDYTCYHSQHIPISPYLLGLLLGDGGITRRNITFTNTNNAVLKNFEAELEPGFFLKLQANSVKDYDLRCNGQRNIYADKLDGLALLGCNSHKKFIPKSYLYNSYNVRVALIQGLMDTDGTISKRGHCSLTTASENLANDFKQLIQSIGGLCKIVLRHTTCNGKQFQSYRCHIRINDTSVLFRHPEKLKRCKRRKKSDITRKIVKVTYLGKKKAVCIQVDHPDHLYITDNHVITHNTVTSLHILAKAQAVGRPTYFLNVEGRIKTRDLRGIKGLDLDKLNIVRSYKDENGKTRILTAREFLTAAEHTIHNVPGAVIVIDSISQLATDKEMELELGEMDRASGAILMAKFCKRLSNVIPINDIILVGIQHFISNVSGMGKWKIASGGRKIQYACDVGLECKSFKFIHEGGEEGPVIGQTVDWITTSTALNAAPGQKTTSIIRYGIGIDELQEIVDIGIDFGFIEQRGAWFRLNFMADVLDLDFEDKDSLRPYQVQGKENLTNRLRENPEEFKHLEDALHQMMGA